MTSTIHSSMGDTVRSVALQIVGNNYELWDKAQIIVALTRTKRGKDVIFVGNKNETIKSIISLVPKRNQWTDFIENVIDLVTRKAPISTDEENRNNTNQHIPTLTTDTFPFRICDITLPQCKSGFVYFLIPVRTMNFTYIGECQCIISRLKRHNSGYGSSSTIPLNKRPNAIFGYIAGFNGGNKILRRHIEMKWKEKRDYLISQGISDPRRWFQIGTNVIAELDIESFGKEKEELRLIELFKT